MKKSTLFILGVLALAACDKKNDKTSAGLGDQAQWDVVASSLIDEIEVRGANKFKQNEKALHQQVVYVQSSPRIKVADIERRVSLREDAPDKLRIETEFLRQIYDIKTGSILDDVFLHGIVNLKLPLKKIEAGGAPDGLTFHEMVVTKELAEPPARVKERADCRNTPNCVLNQTTVQFMKVIHVGQKYYRFREEYAFWPTLPAVANPVRRCTGFFVFVKADNRYVYLRQCRELVDYVYSTDTNPLSVPQAEPKSDSVNPEWVKSVLDESDETLKVYKKYATPLESDPTEIDQ